MPTFNLLKSLRGRFDVPSHVKLVNLKHLTNEFLSLHNQLIQVIWNLSLAVEECDDEEEKIPLIIKIKRLQTELEKTQSEARLTSLFDEIKQLETKLLK